MPVTVQHVLTATTPDNTQYEIRPSHWNSAHSVSFSAAANEVIKWASAGTGSISSGTLVFSNANGLSFGMNNGTVTASHNGLTTGAASDHSHGNPTLALTNLTGTTASNSAGFTLSLSAAAPGGGADGGVGISAGANSQSNGTVVFSNANGVTFGLNASTVTASHNGLTSQSNQAFSAPGGSSAFQTLVFANSNNVSWSNSNGSVVGSVAAQSNQSVGLYAVSNTTQSSSATVDARSLSFAGAGAISIGASNGSVVISAAAGAQSVQTLGIYASSNTTGQSSSSTIDARSLSVRGIGAISAGLSGGELVLSVAAGAQSNQTGGVYFVGNTTGQSSSSTYDARTLSVDGAGIVSAGWSNGTIRVSATQSNQAFSAAGGSSAFQTLGFSNANGATFTNTNGSVGLSYTVPTQVSAYAVSNTTQSTTGTLPLNSLQFAGAGAASVGISNGSIVISAPSPGAATLTVSAVGNTTVNSSGTWPNAVSIRGYGVLSVGTSNGSLLLSTPDPVDFTQLSVGFSTGGNTAGDTGVVTGRLVLVGSNNITLSGSTNGGSQTLSIIGAAGGGAAVTASAANGSYTVGTLSFSNANGVSFGTSAGSAITASHNGLTSQSNQAFSAQGGSSAFQTLIFTNSNGVSFSNTNGSVWASVAAQTNQSGGIYVTAQSTGQSSSSTYDARSLSLVGDGIVSAGWSNGTLRISATQSNQAFSAQGGSSAFQTLVFTNSNGVSFSNTNGSVWASVNTSYRASNDAIGLNTAATNVTWTVNSSGLSLNAAGYAGTGTSATNASITLNSNGLAISVAAPGAAAENNWVNLLGANTSGNTTASGSTLGLSGVNLTLSGTNASQIVLSAPATSSLSATGQVSISTNGSTISIGVPNEITLSRVVYPPDYIQLAATVATNNSISFNYLSMENYASASVMQALFSVSANTHTSASTNTWGLTMDGGIYTRTGSTISLASSGSQSYSGTYSTNATSSLGGVRVISVPINAFMTPGEYWYGLRMSTSSSNASIGYSIFAVSGQNTAYLNAAHMGEATNTSHLLYPMNGMFSATSAALPASASLNQILGSGTQGSRANFYFDVANYTLFN